MMFKLEFTEQEFQDLAGLVDAGVRATGIRSVMGASAILGKLEAAAALATKEKGPIGPNPSSLPHQGDSS